MKTITIHAAKTNLSRLIEEACSGEEIVIARGRQPVARLVPIVASERGRRFGALKGILTVDDRFFEPLPESDILSWET